MTKLLEHFKAMQGKVGLYLEPADGWTDHTGKFWPDEQCVEGFATDMIYMLDGPEQRAAEEEEQALMRERNEHSEWRMDIRKQVEQSDAVAKGWKEKADKLERDNNELRTRLMNRELDYAKLRGYLEAQREAQPPVLVPQPRELFLAQMNDGSGYAAPSGWAGRDERKEWFHR